MVSASFEIAPVPDRLTTTGVPFAASPALMPPPLFSVIEVIDGAVGDVWSSTLSVTPLLTMPVAETLTRSTIAALLRPDTIDVCVYTKVWLTPTRVAVKASVAPASPQSLKDMYWVAAATSPRVVRLWMPKPSLNETMPLLIVCDLIVSPVCKRKVELLLLKLKPTKRAENPSNSLEAAVAPAAKSVIWPYPVTLPLMPKPLICSVASVPV